MLTQLEIKKLKIRYPDRLFCHQCGFRDIILESVAEGYWCPNCGSSDSDE